MRDNLNSLKFGMTENRDQDKLFADLEALNETRARRLQGTRRLSCTGAWRQQGLARNLPFGPTIMG
jgi:hypothetical protein